MFAKSYPEAAADKACLVLALILLILCWFLAEPAFAVSLGEMAAEAADDFETIPTFLSIILYIVGAILVFVGLLRVKRHFDYPQQATLGGGMITILVGVALIAAPAVINAVGDTFGAGSTSIDRPRL